MTTSPDAHLSVPPPQDHFLFDKPVSPLLTCAGMARDWPDARGIWSVLKANRGPPILDVRVTWLGYVLLL